MYYYVAYWLGIASLLPEVFRLFLGMTFLMGPCLLGYVLSSFGRPFRGDHFFPFVLWATTVAILSIFKVAGASEIWGLLTVLQTLHLWVYVWLIWQTLLVEKAVSSWYSRLFISFAIYALGFSCYYLLVWTGVLQIEHDYFISLISSLVIYYVGYEGLAGKRNFQAENHRKYQRSSLSYRASREVFEEVKQYIEVTNSFTNSDLRLDDIASGTGISKHKISQAINEVDNRSFSEFINAYRIEKAKKLLSDPHHQDHKIIHIAYLAGFNNKVSFGNTFRRFTGDSPSTYRDRHATGKNVLSKI